MKQRAVQHGRRSRRQRRGPGTEPAPVLTCSDVQSVSHVVAQVPSPCRSVAAWPTTSSSVRSVTLSQAGEAATMVCGDSLETSSSLSSPSGAPIAASGMSTAGACKRPAGSGMEAGEKVCPQQGKKPRRPKQAKRLLIDSAHPTDSARFGRTIRIGWGKMTAGCMQDLDYATTVYSCRPCTGRALQVQQRLGKLTHGRLMSQFLVFSDSRVPLKSILCTHQSAVSQFRVSGSIKSAQTPS